MIIKGQSRRRARDLARHLLRTDHNETVRLFECRGTLAQDVEGALREMEALTITSHCARPLYHASISPEKHLPLTDAQVRIAADTLEEKLGLFKQPRLIVLHRKEGRDHVHVVWSRIDIDHGRAIPDSWNYRHHEAAARALEAAFGHPMVRGAGTVHRAERRSRRAPKEYEYRQAERSGVPTTQVADELTALWRNSAGGREFQARLAKAGYTLARGDRRVFVVIDRAGNVHSLARRLGLSTKELRDRLHNMSMEALPSVADAREGMRRRTRQTAVTCAYREAAQETTSRSSRGAATRSPTMRRGASKPKKAIPPEQIAWINSPMHEGRRTALRIPVHRHPAVPKTYQAARAIIVAEFAVKIAAAIKHASRDEVDAILEALKSERAAALRLLVEQTKSGMVARRRLSRRRPQRKAWPHSRGRSRRRAARRRNP